MSRPKLETNSEWERRVEGELCRRKTLAEQERKKAADKEKWSLRKRSEKQRFEEASVEELKKEKIWYFIPVLAFPHTLLFAYGYQLILSLYFGNWTFVWTVVPFMIFMSIGFVWSSKWLSRFCLFSISSAIVMFFYLSVIMAISDYSSTRVSARPAPQLSTCLFLLFLNLLSVWPFLVLSKIVDPTIDRATLQDSEYERELNMNVGRVL